MPSRLVRLARMTPSEIAWRGMAAARTALEYSSVAAVGSRWNRGRLKHLLASDSAAAFVRSAVAAGRWTEANAALSTWFGGQPQRFVISPSDRGSLRSRVLARFPDSADDAAGRAERILEGSYDLLGYRGLRFDHPSAISGPSAIDHQPSAIHDWHQDPVHHRQAPRCFWSKVPFLDPACGDHKIIWELNRHQHWITLGRAFWLTGDARYRQAALHQLTSWLDANPPLVGVNWASMLELAFRAISWIWALNFFVDPDADDDLPWLVDLLVGLDRQLDHVEHHLSYYFSPNTHLLGEGLALYVAGIAVPLLARSDERTATGRRILLAEASRQVAGDGGHCERSAHYHRYALDFYLLALICAKINDDPAADEFTRIVERLARAARVLCDSSGRLPHIGDDDGGMAMPLAGRDADDVRDSLAVASLLLDQPDLAIGPLPEEAFWLLSHPVWAGSLDSAPTRPATAAHVRSAALPDTGYYVSRSPAGSHLVFDAGQHGFANAGHAHADALSLTLTLRDGPLLIDPGTGCYTVDEATRDRFRSTSLHNTVTLDQQPSSRPRGPFHWETMADGEARRWCAGERFDYAEAQHRGYAPTAHRRHVLAVHDDAVLVADLIAGDAGHLADAHWHLAPAWTASFSSDRRVILRRGSDRLQLAVAEGELTIVSGSEDGSGLGWHAPVYGRIEPITTIRLSRHATAPFWLIAAFGIEPDNPIEQVEVVPVWAEAGVLEHAVAVKVTRQTTVDRWLIADAAGAPMGGSWRAGSMETDARMLWWRADQRGRLTRLVMLDGSRLHWSGHEDVQIDLAGSSPRTHLELDRQDAHAVRLSGSPGASVRVDGQTLSVVTNIPETAPPPDQRRNAGGHTR